MWEFFIYYLRKYKYEPKSLELKEAVKKIIRIL